MPYNSHVLGKCPQCDYPLTGLPANHNCPECGLPYDQRSEFYSFKRPVVTLAACLVAAGVCVLPYLENAGAPVFGVTGRTGLALAATLHGGLLVVIGWTAFRACRRQFAAVLPDGLYLRLRKRRPEMIPWAFLTKPTEVKWACTVHFNRTDGADDVVIHGVFRRKADIRRLRLQIEERIAEAKRLADQPGGPDKRPTPSGSV